jgi:hypothetical protein
MADEKKRISAVNDVFDSWKRQGASGKAGVWSALQNAPIPGDEKVKMAKRLGFVK